VGIYAFCSIQKYIAKERKNKMLNLKNKKISSMIALILMISMTTSIMFLPNTSAHDPPWNIPTYAFVTASPNPVGVGDFASIVFWTDQNPPTAGGETGQHWEHCSLSITKPDGSKDTINEITIRSATGSDWVQYVPDQVGTYSITFTFPGAIGSNGTGTPKAAGIPFIGDRYLASTSEPFKLVVTQEPTPQISEPALPTDYWSRPINAANRVWSVLASNWLGGSWLVNLYQRWGSAPESPHIVWSKPFVESYAGGISDAQWPGNPEDINDYENAWSTPIIMDGKIFYNNPQVSDWAAYGYKCRDLYTGELLWAKNGTDNGLPSLVQTAGSYSLMQSYPTLTQGYMIHYNGVNGQGILNYLIMKQTASGGGQGAQFTNAWYLLDAEGNYRMRVVNVPSGFAVTDQDGNILQYAYNKNTGNLLCWNLTQSIPPLGPTGTNQQQWRARFGATIDAVNDTTWAQVGPSSVNDIIDVGPRSGYTMNVTIQKGLPDTIQVLTDENRVPKYVFGSWMEYLGMSTSGAEYQGTLTSGSGEHFSAWCASINEHVTNYSPYPDKTATQNNNLGFGSTLLWYKNYTVPITGKNYTWNIGGSGGYEGLGDVSYDGKVFVLICKQTRQMWGYSLETGNMLWGPTESLPVMDYYGFGGVAYDGKIITAIARQHSGTVVAFDATTGEKLWNYNATAIGRASPYGENYPVQIGAVCDGKIYLYSNEHSPTKPLFQGSCLRCINLTDGTEMWKLLDFNMGMSLADGYIVTGNEYDNNIYCIGKGESGVTVSAPDIAQPLGTNILIKGTVTDQSPGAKGTPAIADADMQAWMEYLYEQQTMPTNAKGVDVVLSVIDANGNYRDIGTTTSNTDGFYSFNWKPDIEGKYTIYASFAGSKSYWPSHAVTAFSVDSAAPTVAPTAAPVESTADLYFVPAIAGLFVFVAIIGVVIILVLKKRP